MRQLPFFTQKHNEKVRSKRFKEKSQLLAPGSSSISADELAEIDALNPSFNEEELLIDLDQKYKNVVKKVSDVHPANN